MFTWNLNLLDKITCKSQCVKSYDRYVGTKVFRSIDHLRAIVTNCFHLPVVSPSCPFEKSTIGDVDKLFHYCIQRSICFFVCLGDWNTNEQRYCLQVRKLVKISVGNQYITSEGMIISKERSSDMHPVSDQNLFGSVEVWIWNKEIRCLAYKNQWNFHIVYMCICQNKKFISPASVLLLQIRIFC